jgi:hypothetical protein
MGGSQERQRGRPGESAWPVDPVLQGTEAPALATEPEALEQHPPRDEVVVLARQPPNVFQRRTPDGVVGIHGPHRLAEPRTSSKGCGGASGQRQRSWDGIERDVRRDPRPAA